MVLVWEMRFLRPPLGGTDTRNMTGLACCCVGHGGRPAGLCGGPLGRNHLVDNLAEPGQPLHRVRFQRLDYVFGSDA